MSADQGSSETKFPKFFPIDNKPDISEVEAFFNEQVKTTGTIGLTHSVDEMGNRIFISEEKMVPAHVKRNHDQASVVISPDGAKLLKANPKLLRSLSAGSLPDAQPFREGTEGKTYVFEVNGKKYVAKYTFPVKLEKLRAFTSPIAQMYMLQKANRELRGFHFIEPLIATHYASVAPYVEHLIPFHRLQSAMYARRFEQDVQLEEDDRVALEGIINIFPTSIGPPSEVRQYCGEVEKDIRDVDRWTETTLMRTNQLPGSSTLVPDIRHNCLVSIPKFIGQYNHFQRSDLQGENSVLFSEATKDTLYFNELINGSVDHDSI